MTIDVIIGTKGQQIVIKTVLGRVTEIALDPRWWGFYLQRRFMNPDVRRWIAKRVARLKPAAEYSDDSAAIRTTVNELSAAGSVMLGELLDPAQRAEVFDYFVNCKVHNPYKPGTAEFLPGSTERPPNSHVAHHSDIDVLRAPYLLGIANDPRILKIVSEFLGCKPTIGYLTAWWSYHTGVGAQEAELFHRDVDDWKFVKLFVYLTDVELDTGPHVYVRHSSTSRALTQIRRFTDEEVQSAFGNNNVRRITAKAGQGFLVDTFGLHKGQPVERGTRAIFQVVYSISSLPYGPKAPVVSRADLGAPNIDPFINRVYVK
jgi:hypothetical protein